MRYLFVSSIVAILLAGFATSAFATQVAKTKTMPTVKSNQPSARAIKPGLKSNLFSNEKDVGKQKVGDSLNDLSQEQQLKMQMEMDRITKAEEAASNLEKKRSDTAKEIIGNMK